MKHLLLELHSEKCSCNKNSNNSNFGNGFTVGPNITYCEDYPRQMIIFVKNDFYILEFFSCLASEWSDQYSFAQYLIKQIIGRYKILKYYDVYKSYCLTDALVKNRLQNIPYKKYVREVNFIYGNVYNKYAIVTISTFIEHVVNYDIVRENYLKAKKYLIENNMEYMMKELDDLYNVNYDSLDSFTLKREIVKSIDHLVKQINSH
jgi:hypothetical protein